MDYAADAAVDYGPDGPVDYASEARCGLRCFASVDYAPAVLWISQPFGLGRIYPGFALWISGGVGADFAPTPLRQD